MPYIPRERRFYLDPHLDNLSAEIGEEGELNYAITMLVLAWLGGTPRYADYNAAIGVLTCAQLELYRERVSVYEDRAKVINGPLSR